MKYLGSITEAKDLVTKEYVDSQTTTLKNGQVATNTSNITKNETAIATLRSDIQTGETINDFGAVETALAGKQAAGDYATKAEAQGYADAKDTAIADAKKAGTDAQASVDALTAENGAITKNTAAIAALETESATHETKTDAASKLTEAKEYTDALANGQVKTNTEAIATLNGDNTVAGSVDKKITDAINDFSTKVTDNGTIDTFKELVDYVGTHGGEAAEMASAIDALETKVGEKSVQVQILEAITAANLDQYATDEDLSAMDTAYKAADTTLQDNIDAAVTRVGALETDMDTAEGKITTLETKMATVEESAEKNIIEAVKVNGAALEVNASDRSVDISVPTGVLAIIFGVKSTRKLGSKIGKSGLILLVNMLSVIKVMENMLVLFSMKIVFYSLVLKNHLIN